jgi:hypothetical protein
MKEDRFIPTPNRFGTLLLKCRQNAPREDGGTGYSQIEVEQLSFKMADKFPESEPISRAHLSAVEVGRHRMTDPMLRMLIYLYKLDDETIVQLMKLPVEGVNATARPTYIPFHLPVNTPPQAARILEKIVEWASQGASLEQYRAKLMAAREDGQEVNNESTTESIAWYGLTAAEVEEEVLAADDPRSIVMAEQKASTSKNKNNQNKLANSH